MSLSPPRSICLRCEWSGATDERRRCPRCDVPLYRERLTKARRVDAAPLATAREADAEFPPVEFLGPDGAPMRMPVSTPRRGPRKRRRAAATAIGLVITLAAGLIASNRPEGRAPPPRDPSIDPFAPAAPVRVSLPGPVSSLERGLESVTLVTSQPAGDGRTQLHRLWRLILSTGTLVPGPVVAEVRELRLDRRRDRLAFLVHGGALFSLRGLHASRPTWVAGGVEGFDIDPDGSLLYVPVTGRTAPWGGGREAAVTIARSRPAAHTRLASRIRTRVRGLLVQGVAVESPGVMVWGLRGGEQVVTVIDAAGRRPPVERRLGWLRLVDVGPGGRLLLGREAGPGEVAPVLATADGSAPVALANGFRMRGVSAWSPDGRTLAAVGAHPGGRSGVWAIPADGGQAWSVPGAPVDGPIAFSPQGRLVLWAGRDELGIVEVGSRRLHRIAFPPGFPTPTAALVVG